MKTEKKMNDAPKFHAGDVVYRRSSATRGFLEPVNITIIAKITGTWVYGINTGKPKQPTAPTYFGDRINFGFSGPFEAQQVYYTESEFVLICEALGMAEAYLQSQLSAIQIQLVNLCGTGG